MMVRVRGRLVAFDIQTIIALYCIPSLEMDGYRAFMQEPVNYMKILNTLCHRGATWKTNMKGELVNFKATFLKNDPLAWFLLVAARIIPSSHSSDVTKDRDTLAYCIMTERTVYIGKIIQASVLHAAPGNSTIGLPHSALIT